MASRCRQTSARIQRIIKPNFLIVKHANNIIPLLVRCTLVVLRTVDPMRASTIGKSVNNVSVSLNKLTQRRLRRSLAHSLALSSLSHQSTNSFFSFDYQRYQQSHQLTYSLVFSYCHPLTFFCSPSSSLEASSSRAERVN